MKKILLSTFIVVFSISELSCAASFDCAKASTYVEKLICSDETVSKLDEQMTAAYKKALDKALIKDDLKMWQRVWLGYRRDTCKDVDCLILNYKQRIDWLNETAAMEIPKNTVNGEYIWIKNALNSIADPIQKPEDKNVCQDFLKNLNSFRSPTPMICETKLNSSISGFKAIDWRAFDVAKYSEIIRNIALYINRVDQDTIKKIHDDEVWKKYLEIYKDNGYLDYVLIDLEKNGKPGTLIRLNKLKDLGCNENAHLYQESMYFYIAKDISKGNYLNDVSVEHLFDGLKGEIFIYNDRIYLLFADGSQPVGSTVKKVTEYRFSQLKISVGHENYTGDEVCRYQFIWPTK